MVAAAQTFFNVPKSPFDTADDDEEENEPDLLCVEDGVGIIPIRGPMLRNPDLISQLLFGATDIEDIMEAVNAAAVRPDVQAVFLDIDSPGGSVSGTPELAQAVADLCKAKYTYAFSGGQMCSAAYWVASQCDASTPEKQLDGFIPHYAIGLGKKRQNADRLSAAVAAAKPPD